MDTAGRSVVFAGATVVISLLGMLLMGIGFVGGLGITASLTVAVTVARVDHAAARAARLRRRQHRAHEVARPGRRRLRRPRRSSAPASKIPALDRRSASASRVLTIVLGFFVAPLKREVQHRPPKPRRETVAYRWSRVIQHRPWTVRRSAATAVLLVLAIPVLSLRLGFSDESNFADDTTTKQAYDLVVEGFGKGSTGPDLPRRRGRRRRAGRRARRGQRGGRRRSRRSSRSSGRSPTTPTTRPRSAGSSRPTGGPQDEATTAARQPPARRRAPAGRGGGGRRRARHRARRRQRRHVGLHGRADADLLRRRARRCRSCC